MHIAVEILRRYHTYHHQGLHPARILKYASAISRNFFSSLDPNLCWSSQPAANIMAICSLRSMCTWMGPPIQYRTRLQKECSSSVEYSVGPSVAIVIIGLCWWWEQRSRHCDNREMLVVGAEEKGDRPAMWRPITLQQQQRWRWSIECW